MDVSPYVIFQIILSILALQLILLQFLIFLKQKEIDYIWSITLGITVLIYCLSEAYFSRIARPVFGETVVKIQHSAITIYSVSLIAFWFIFLKNNKLKRLLTIFIMLSSICILSIWFTNWHMSGEYMLSITNEGSFFRIEQWYYTNIGPFFLVEMLLMLSSYIIVIIYLYKYPVKFIENERKYFVIAYIIHLLCIGNDISEYCAEHILITVDRSCMINPVLYPDIFFPGLISNGMVARTISPSSDS